MSLIRRLFGKEERKSRGREIPSEALERIKRLEDGEKLVLGQHNSHVDYNRYADALAKAGLRVCGNRCICYGLNPDYESEFGLSVEDNQLVIS